MKYISEIHKNSGAGVLFEGYEQYGSFIKTSLMKRKVFQKVRIITPQWHRVSLWRNYEWIVCGPGTLLNQSPSSRWGVPLMVTPAQFVLISDQEQETIVVNAGFQANCAPPIPCGATAFSWYSQQILKPWDCSPTLMNGQPLPYSIPYSLP